MLSLRYNRQMLKIFNDFSLPKIGQNYKRTAPVGSAFPILLNQILAQTISEKRLLVIFCDSLNRIEELSEQIKWLNSNARVSIMPDWEILPYDQFSPHKELISERIWAFYQLISGGCDLLLITTASALTRLAPQEFFLANSFVLKVGDKFDKNNFTHRLVSAGYQNVSQVLSPGEWAVRGGLIDLFPMSSASPCRIELEDELILSLRVFDSETQRTIYPTNELKLLPAREFPFDDKAIEHFRQKFRESFAVNPASCPIYKSVSAKTSFVGAEYYLSLFCEKTSTIFDYLPQNALWVQDININQSIADYQRLITESYKSRANDDHRPILPIAEVFITENEFFEKLTNFARISFVNDKTEKLDNQQINQENHKHEETQAINIFENKEAVSEKISGLQAFKNWQMGINAPIFLWVESAGRLSVIADLLRDSGIIFEIINFDTPKNNDKTQTLPSFDNLDKLPLEKISKYINNFDTKNTKIHLAIAPFEIGFMAINNPNKPFVWICENDIFPNTAISRSRRRAGGRAHQKIENWIRDLTELAIGDLVVHQSYGIGRYQGLINLDYGEGDNEFLHLEYANSAKLYVPITQLQLIGRFSAVDNEKMNLHTLGSGEWEKALSKAEKQVADTAAELFALYALRNANAPPPVNFEKIELEKFAEGFGFELTIDQEVAINDVVNDMAGEGLNGVVGLIKMSNSNKSSSNKASKAPMDRLICGDVGFGKTEVAMRAAFVAMSAGYQVSLLCPTTLLAEQHGATFTDRFAKYTTVSNIPYNIVTLSRFRSAAEQKKALSEISEGKVDLVIGTHRLLQKDISFKNLGLIIIDEEHRFGVKHKETLKKLRANAHVLTMSATPIPRTLSLSLEGIRDFSVMSTPPSRRLAVKTMIGQNHPAQVREAALREFRRGGQVFFVHNEVQTIEIQRKKLSEVLPEARIAVAHGQMSEKELEPIMRAFRNQEFNLLLCTTIIENGIDIANANTILINKAERFGIAQLHQLRGRVGRSHHQAYCYFLIEAYSKLSKPAKQRLEALCASHELGAGFYLAMHDLEIRGAGEILGENQSGTIEQIGFELYLQMLSKATRDFQKSHPDSQFTQISAYSSGQCEEVNLHTSAFIPDSYCPDITERLKIYKRLSGCENSDEISEIRMELADRFGIMRDGSLPEKVENLLSVHRIRVSAKELGIYKIDANVDNINLYFNLDNNFNISPEKILQILRKNPKWMLKGNDRIQITAPTIKVSERINLVNQAFSLLKNNY